MSDARIISSRSCGQDQAALQAYYTDLFGWKLDTSNQGGYSMTDAAATGVTVGVGATRNGSAGGVTGYITVDDIDATLARADCPRRQRRHAEIQPGPRRHDRPLRGSIRKRHRSHAELTLGDARSPEVRGAGRRPGFLLSVFPFVGRVPLVGSQPGSPVSVHRVSQVGGSFTGQLAAETTTPRSR